MTEKTIALVEAAQLLGISWQRGWRLLLIGALRGEKRDGRWRVNAADVEKLARAAPPPALPPTTT